MSSAKASASRTITFTRRMGNITAFISCDQGDVYFDYKLADNYEASNYVPQLSSTNTRTLELNVIDSLGTNLDIVSVDWFVNASPISANSYFLPDPTTHNLIIRGIIPAAIGNNLITITAVAKVAKAGSTDKVEVRASYHIPVRQWSDKAWRVMIAAVDNEANYTIKDADGLDVRCIVYDPEGNEKTDGVSCNWYKLGVDGSNTTPGWISFAATNNANSNTNTIHIPESAVDNQAMFKVEASIGGEVVGMDTQMIYDSHDPYAILVFPEPADETIREDDPTHQQIDYKINISRTHEDTKHPKRAKVTFFLYDTVGNSVVEGDLNREWENIPWVYSTADKTGFPEFAAAKTPTETIFTVYASDCVNAGDLTLNISAEIFD